MILIRKTFIYAFRSHIFENGQAGSFLDGKVLVMQGQQQCPERSRTNLPEAFRTLNPNRRIGLLRHSLDKHELTLGAKVCDREQRTVPDRLVLVEQTSVEEWQQALCLQIGHLICCMTRFLSQDVQ